MDMQMFDKCRLQTGWTPIPSDYRYDLMHFDNVEEWGNAVAVWRNDGYNSHYLNSPFEFPCDLLIVKSMHGGFYNDIFDEDPRCALDLCRAFCYEIKTALAKKEETK